MTTDKQSPEEIVKHLAGSMKPDELIALIRRQAQSAHREKLAAVADVPVMAEDHWTARRRLLLDGEQVHGTLDEFYLPALAAIRANDQAEYARQMDLIFSALRTMLGDPAHAAPTALPEVATTKA